MSKNLAPRNFIELLKDIYICVDGLYSPKYNNTNYNVDNCDFEEIKYSIDFVDKFEDFLEYYKAEIAGKDLFVTSILYFDIYYNYNGFGKRVRLNSLMVERYFNDNIGFG